MNEQDFIKRVLDQDLTADSLQDDRECAESASSDPAQQAALNQIDKIRQALGQGDRADSSAEPTDGWDEFEDRLAVIASSNLQQRQAAVSHPFYITPWLGWIVATAACLGLVVVLWSGRNDQPDQTAASANETPPPIAMVPSASELQERIGVFSEINSAFDNRAHWVSTASGDADMGLGEPNSEASRLIVARLTMQIVDSSEPPIQVDLVIVSGQQAVVTVPLRTGLQVTYRIDTRIKNAGSGTDFTLWAEFQTPGAYREMRGVLGTSATYQAGRVQGVGRIRIDGQSYILDLGFGGVEEDTPAVMVGPATRGDAI